MAMLGKSLVPHEDSESGDVCEAHRSDASVFEPTAEDWSFVASFRPGAPFASDSMSTMTTMALVNATIFGQDPVAKECKGGLAMFFGNSPIKSRRLQLFWAEVGRNVGFYVLSSCHEDYEVQFRPQGDAAIPFGGLKLCLAVEACRLLMGKLNMQIGPNALVEVRWCKRLVWKGLLRSDFTCDTIAIVLEAAMKPLYGLCKIEFAGGSEGVLPSMQVGGGRILEFVVMPDNAKAHRDFVIVPA